MRQKGFFVHLHSPSQYASKRAFSYSKSKGYKDNFEYIHPSNTAPLSSNLRLHSNEEMHEKLLKWFVVFFVFMMLITTLKFYRDFTNPKKSLEEIEYENAILHFELDYYKQREIETYNMFITSANSLINQNNLIDSQHELELALKLFPHGKRANMLMFKVLALRCFEFDQHCSEAWQYYYALYRNPDIDKIELNYLKRYLTLPNGELTQ